MTPKSKREPANVLCVICGAPVTHCTIGGLHGMIRDRAALAASQKGIVR